ncbi:MAG: epoxyqueuosine reductase QueH [Bacteroidales bacterium]|nr:epoxyqueuosine reductase QueH [Bacteroidales bacterium]
MGQKATGSNQEAASSRQEASGSNQEAASSRQEATGSNQEAASSRQEATGSNQEAASSRQEATDGGQGPGSQEPRGLVVIDDVYDHEAWRCAVRGLECEPERGQRCLQCFRFRLERAARYAHEHGFNVLTTTLASSRWKDLEQVDAAGSYACSLFPGLRWWGRNWRKGGLQERRSAIIREQNFYNQTWCGCEFSHHDKTNEPTCPLPVEAPSR